MEPTDTARLPAAFRRIGWSNLSAQFSEQIALAAAPLAAVLLRELSSLGLDDEPTPAVATRRTPRVPAPRHAATSSKKKRGIFGR